MGAIYGIVGEADRSAIHAMGRRLAHRGEGASEWPLSPTVHLGQRFDDGSAGLSKYHGVVLDGFIDNLTELIGLLGRTHSTEAAADPGEIVFNLVRKFGLKGLRFLKGHFALALWDEKNHRLILARDRVGGRPLFFAQLPHCFLFASEYKALLAIDELPARPNRDVIQYVQCRKTMPAHTCCLEGVYALPPGYWLKLEDGCVEKDRYWDIAIAPGKGSEELHIAGFRKAFSAAVQKQTEGYDPIGIALSGVDSAATLAGMRQIAPSKTIHSFTAGFGPEDRDMVICAELARHFGTIHHEIVLQPDDLEEILPKVVWHMGDPVGREDKPYLFVTNREAAKYVKLVMTGFFSDNLFGGMPRHKLVKAATTAPLLGHTIEEFYRFTQTGEEPRSMLGRSLVKLYFRGQDYPPPTVIGANGFPVMDRLACGKSEPLNEHLRSHIFNHPGFSPAESLHAVFGLSFNSPFMDPSVIKRAFEIPDSLKMPTFSGKYIVRRAFAELLPDFILKRKKTLLRMKHNERFACVLDGLAERYLSTDAVSSRRLFERAYVEQLRRRNGCNAYSTERAYRLWSLILTEIWCRLYLDKRGASAEMSN
jgi:asparagine synthase (glutamine-hydrolysing)